VNYAVLFANVGTASWSDPADRGPTVTTKVELSRALYRIITSLKIYLNDTVYLNTG